MRLLVTRILKCLVFMSVRLLTRTLRSQLSTADLNLVLLDWWIFRRGVAFQVNLHVLKAVNGVSDLWMMLWPQMPSILVTFSRG